MNLDEFLSLPKRKRSPIDRIRRRVRKLRGEIETTGEETPNEIKNCCGKATYDTEEDALIALREIRNGRRVRNKKPIRVYQCPQGKWHLSSRPDKLKRK